MPEAEPHQFVIGRVVLDLVAAMSVAVVRVENGRVLVREAAEFERLGAAAELPERVRFVGDPTTAFALDGFAQRRVGFEEVVVFERRRLVEDGADRVSGHRRSGLTAFTAR